MYHSHQGINVNRNIPVEAHTIDPQHQLYHQSATARRETEKAICEKLFTTKKKNNLKGGKKEGGFGKVPTTLFSSFLCMRW
jgi:hypothetical protein